MQSDFLVFFFKILSFSINFNDARKKERIIETTGALNSWGDRTELFKMILRTSELLNPVAEETK